MLDDLKRRGAESHMAPLFAQSLGGTVSDGASQVQLDNLRRLDGARAVFAFPDIHPGKGIPIGSTLVTQGGFYPHVAGSDIGCGVLLCRVDTGGKRVDFERLAKRDWFSGGVPDQATESLERLEAEFPEEAERWGRAGFCSVGGGNHFAEIGTVSESCEDSPLSRGDTWLMVHTGSRSLGDAIAWWWGSVGGGAMAKAGSEDGRLWLAAHDYATRWARLNRRACAMSVAREAGWDVCEVADVWHNGIGVEVPEVWPEWADPSAGPLFVHRKGAAVAGGLVPLPSSRGEESFLMLADGAAMAGAGMSVAHGAGRRWRRSECKDRLSSRMRVEDMERTSLGSFVHCKDRDLLWEEAPQAYKSGDSCARALESCGFARRLCSLRPGLTIKA